LLAVIAFAVPKVLRRKNSLPPSFSWLGLGLLSAIVGCYGVIFEHLPIFKVLMFRGFLVGIFMGIGGRLIPFLTGISGNAIVETKFTRQEPVIHALLAVVFFLGLVAENIGIDEYERAGIIFQVVALLIEMVFIWKLYKKPGLGARAKILWSASWCLPIASVFSAINPNWSVHFYHIAFVGCFFDWHRDGGKSRDGFPFGV
jgi:hypothetical protein